MEPTQTNPTPSDPTARRLDAMQKAILSIVEQANRSFAQIRETQRQNREYLDQAKPQSTIRIPPPSQDIQQPGWPGTITGEGLTVHQTPGGTVIIRDEEEQPEQGILSDLCLHPTLPDPADWTATDGTGDVTDADHIMALGWNYVDANGAYNPAIVLDPADMSAKIEALDLGLTGTINVSRVTDNGTTMTITPVAITVVNGRITAADDGTPTEITWDDFECPA